MKISFLICAHNEEKVIASALENLTKLHYSNKEIIVGLDGCTDQTGAIVKQYPSVIIYQGRNRLGKSKLLNKLLKLAKGDIIVIHDADWKFVCPPKSLAKLVALFKTDPKLGGVDFPHPHPDIEDRKKVRKIRSTLFIGTAWGSKLITEYQWETYRKKERGLWYLDKDKMELPLPVSVFRKKVISSFDLIHDDAIVTMEALRKGYKIQLLDRTYPYFVVTDQYATAKGILNQKKRTSIGWSQVENKYPRVSMKRIYPKLLWYFLKRFPDIRPLRAKLGFVYWLVLTFLGTLKGKLLFKQHINTQEAWAFRTARRGTGKN